MQLPNVLIFIVDDLGWNQVGYHARRVDNTEIDTPNIDQYATVEGVEMNRGYMTPWCGPSRASLLTGRTNSYNPNITNYIWDHFYSFDDDIGFVGGLPPGTVTLAEAFKAYGKSVGVNYTAYYEGKWGIGGTAWTNTPVGMGFDKFVGFWGDSLETCDGWHSWSATPPYVALPGDPNYGALFVQAMPGYWEQKPNEPDNQWCEYFREQVNQSIMSQQDADIGCKTQPRNITQLLDIDILESVLGNIRDHDYEAGPLFQVHAPQLMHLPMNYPKEFDQRSPHPDQPEYFRDGQEKPPPTNKDLRWATTNALKFVDDMFGQVMQEIKDAGQWDNTIVLFTSDNGGAIYVNTANNNYPSRGAKFSGFDGGTRVPQFLTGGWLEQNLHQSRKKVSETFMFPQDWAPTLLEMSGADASFLLGGNSGLDGPYGQEMWEYIRRSVDPQDVYAEGQKIRKASFSPSFFFDVQSNRTMKLWHVGDTPVMTPRKWAPIWPTDSDYIPGFQDWSVRPCRPRGEALKCCYTDILNDPKEDEPLFVDCDTMSTQAKQLYVLEDDCEKTPKATMCLEPSSTVSGVPPEEVKLWSKMGSPGPFVASGGLPVGSDLSMSCICRQIDQDPDVSSIDSFSAVVFSPFECQGPSFQGTVRKTSCDGSLTFEPRILNETEYEMEGFDPTLFSQVKEFEQNGLLLANFPTLYSHTYTYLSREGFTEWPNYAKFPDNIPSLDTCAAKGATPVPMPVNSLVPWTFAAEDPRTPSTPRNTLCVRYSLYHWFCPAKQNPLQRAVESWDYSVDPPVGRYFGGDTMNALLFSNCSTECSGDYEGTAYVRNSDENWGLAVDEETLSPSSSPSNGPTESNSSGTRNCGWLLSYLVLSMGVAMVPVPW